MISTRIQIYLKTFGALKLWYCLQYRSNSYIMRLTWFCFCRARISMIFIGKFCSSMGFAFGKIHMKIISHFWFKPVTALHLCSTTKGCGYAYLDILHRKNSSNKCWIPRSVILVNAVTAPILWHEVQLYDLSGHWFSCTGYWQYLPSMKW